jgi:hypothetical protein
MFSRALEWKMLVPIIYGCFVVIWYIYFFRFGMLYKEKSGTDNYD